MSVSTEPTAEPDNWNVLVCGLPLAEDSFNLGPGMVLRRLVQPLSVFDLAADERFRFALEAAVDWRHAKEPRAAVSRVWSGIESLLGINSELVFRDSLYAVTIAVSRGPRRIDAFKRIKGLYSVRSKAVHGEPIAEDKLFSALNDSFDVLRSLILDAVERGTVRTEEDFARELLE